MNEMALRIIQTQLLGSSIRSRFAPPLPTPVPVRGLDMNMARQYVGQLIPDHYSRARLMYDGDHWQGTWEWAGPKPLPSEGYLYVWDLIANGFVSRNVIRAIVNRHVNGVLARMPRWTLMPIEASTGEEEMDDATKELIAEATAFLRDWLASRRVHQMLKDYLVDLLMPTGRACLRFWTPPGLAAALQGTSSVRTLNVGDTVGEALQRIYLERPDPTVSAVITDPDTQRQVGIRLFDKPERAWLTFLDQMGERTFVRSVGNEGGTAGVSYDMGGRLLMYQGKREPLVTRQFIQMQRAMNFALSCVVRTNETAGFIQRIVTNAQLQGKWSKDANGALTFTPDPSAEPVYGPGITNYIQGQVLQDDEGKLQQATPGIHIQEPIAPTGVMDSAEFWNSSMHAEGFQSHILKDSDIAPESARLEYALSLLDSAIPVIDAFHWILGTGLAFAEALRGDVGRYTEQLRPSASAVVNVGPVTPEERNSLIQAAEKAILARETVQEALSVEDVDAENDRIAAQPGAAIDVVIRQMNALKLGVEAGLAIEDVAVEIGITPEKAKLWMANAVKEQERKAEQELAKAKVEGEIAARNRPGRPSGTTERNPGQQQNKGARKLQSKTRDRKSRRAGGTTGAGPA